MGLIDIGVYLARYRWRRGGTEQQQSGLSYSKWNLFVRHSYENCLINEIHATGYIVFLYRTNHPLVYTVAKLLGTWTYSYLHLINYHSTVMSSHCPSHREISQPKPPRLGYMVTTLVHYAAHSTGQGMRLLLLEVQFVPEVKRGNQLHNT